MRPGHRKPRPEGRRVHVAQHVHTLGRHVVLGQQHVLLVRGRVLGHLCYQYRVAGRAAVNEHIAGLHLPQRHQPPLAAQRFGARVAGGGHQAAGNTSSLTIRKVRPATKSENQKS